MEAARSTDEQFAEWYVWAKREISSDNRVCLGAAQAALDALADGGGVEAVRAAARRSTAGHGVVLLGQVSPRRRAYAEWYDWARREVRGEPERLHAATYAAIESLERGGSSAEAAEVARRAAGPLPVPVPVPAAVAADSAVQPGGLQPPGIGAAVPPQPAPHALGVSHAAALPLGMRQLGGGVQAPVLAGQPQNAYGGFWRRVSAWVIDAVILVVGLFVVEFLIGFFYVLGLGASGRDIPAEDFGLALFTIGFALVLTFLYFAGLESSPLQATFGKRMVDLVVTDDRGRRISFLRATARYVAKLLSTLPLGAGCVVAAFTARRQALHDLMVRTVVVRRSYLTAGAAAPSPGPAHGHPRSSAQGA